MFALILTLIGGVGAPLPARAQSAIAPREDDGVHLGVSACAASSCHGAARPSKSSSVRQDEYLIWSQDSDMHRIDSHHKAYAVLLTDRALRIAHNLGLGDAASADACLDCHADNVPPEKRGVQYKLSDGVGCEACHGAAAGWLGVHLTGAGHKANLAAGLYPTEQPIARAHKCLSCHLGDDKRVMTHRIMGAGHPPLPFELDTFTAIEPAHFVVDRSYVERKGPVNGVQVWAIGQAIDVAKRMERLLDPKNAPKGINPELVLFDCASCHHDVSQLRWARRSSEPGPGLLRLYDATAVLVQIIAARVAPADAVALGEHLHALQRGITDDWGTVEREADHLHTAATGLISVLASHDFTRDDMKALADAVVAAAGANTEYSRAEQDTMALDAIIAAGRSAGYVTDDSITAINGALGEAYHLLGSDDAYRPAAFAQALGNLQKAMPP